MNLEIDLKGKKLYIFDIRLKQTKLNISQYLSQDSELLSLTPYTNYLMDNLNT